MSNQPLELNADVTVIALVAAGLALLAIGFGMYVLLAGKNTKMPVKQAASWGLSLVWVLPVLAVTSVLVAVLAPHLFDPVDEHEDTVVASKPRWLRTVRAERDRWRHEGDDESVALVPGPADDGDDSLPAGVPAHVPPRGVFRIQSPDGEVVFELSKDSIGLEVGDHKWRRARPVRGDAAQAVLQTAAAQDAARLPVVARRPDAPAESVAEAPADATASTVDTQTLESDVGLLRPRWMDQVGTAQPDATRVVIEGSPKFTPEEAIASALAKAAELLKADLAKFYGEHGDWTLPIERVRDSAASDFYVEPYKVITAGEPQGIKTNRAFVLIDLTPEVRRQVYLTWRDQIVERRLWAFGGLFGLATLIVATTAGYLRLDTLSHGAYRRRLKLAAVSLIVAGGLALAATLPQV